MATITRKTKPESSLPKCSLYYKEGSSDKEYHLEIKEDGGYYTVHFAYGRRGGTLNHGTKVTKTSITGATSCFLKMRDEKLAKGYTESGVPTRLPVSPPEPDGKVRLVLPPKLHLPKLCEASSEPPEFYIGQTTTGEHSWVLQEKLDGKRIMLRLDSIGGHWAYNKKGVVVPIPVEVVEEALAHCRGLMFDGELIGDVYYVFDLLEFEGRSIRDQTLAGRLFELDALGIGNPVTHHLQVVPSYNDPLYMELALKDYREKRREGVVFKRRVATYVPGRLPDWVKCKFWESVTIRVGKSDRKKRSIRMEMYSVGVPPICVGYCTIPPGRDVPEEGTYAEIKYLYVTPGSTSLYQPSYIGPRDDVDYLNDCKFGTVKFKGE